MKAQKHLIFFIALFTSMASTSQILKTHQWENRLVLIIAKDGTSKAYQNQMEVFDLENEAFKERKLMIYSIFPNKYTIIGSKHNGWIENTKLHETFNPENANFKVVLIGLDGGVKLEQSTILQKEKLFATIDVMPMRRAEINNKN